MVTGDRDDVAVNDGGGRVGRAPQDAVHLAGGVVMRILGRGFGRKQPAHRATAADREWSERVRGIAVLQSAAEQQATRGRMEAELDAQRQRRAQDAQPEACAGDSATSPA